MEYTINPKPKEIIIDVISIEDEAKLEYIMSVINKYSLDQIKLALP